ncbi:hypothetical protein HZS_8161 [Henneguya salminicola]|nr:hypothetical protein HZS_8161 [Henneguya salminicola]
MLSCAGADRLQTGMRGAFGKPLGTVARVKIGQAIMSLRTKPANRDSAIKALCRAKAKFAGRQEIVVSSCWGFTDVKSENFKDMLEAGLIKSDGVGIQHITEHGPLTDWARRKVPKHQN